MNKPRFSIYFWDGKGHAEPAKTKKDLDILVDIIKEDTTVSRAYYVDNANGNPTTVKLPNTPDPNRWVLQS